MASDEVLNIRTCFDCRRHVSKHKGLEFCENTGMVPKIVPYCTVLGKYMEDYSVCKKCFIDTRH